MKPSAVKRLTQELPASYLAVVAAHPQLPRDEEKALAIRAQAGDARAREKLLRHHLSWVISTALRARRGALRLEDVVQEGNIGLVRALETYDPESGNKFATYALWWIRAYIGKYLKGAPSAVRPRAGEYAFQDFSLDAPVGEDGELTHGDLIEDDGPGAEALLGDAQANVQVRRALWRIRKRLGPVAWDVVETRLMRGADGDTLEQVGQRNGVSRERIRQVEVKTRALLADYLPRALAEPGQEAQAAVRVVPQARPLHASGRIGTRAALTPVVEALESAPSPKPVPAESPAAEEVAMPALPSQPTAPPRPWSDADLLARLAACTGGPVEQWEGHRIDEAAIEANREPVLLAALERHRALPAPRSCAEKSTDRGQARGGPQRIPMIGRTFNGLEVLAEAKPRVSPSGQKKLRYECRCACGGTTTVDGAHLRDGKVKRCPACGHRSSAEKGRQASTVLPNGETQAAFAARHGLAVATVHKRLICGWPVEKLGEPLVKWVRARSRTGIQAVPEQAPREGGEGNMVTRTGREQILALLGETKRPMKAAEIGEALPGLSRENVQITLERLRQRGQVVVEGIRPRDYRLAASAPEERQLPTLEQVAAVPPAEDDASSAASSATAGPSVASLPARAPVVDTTEFAEGLKILTLEQLAAGLEAIETELRAREKRHADEQRRIRLLLGEAA